MLLTALSLGLLGYYGVALKWSVLEVGRCLLGMVLLWLPITAALYVALRRSIEDPIVRLALSYSGSYTLTTLLYFGAALVGAKWLFTAGLIVAAAIALLLGEQNFRTLRFPRVDTVLLAIVAASLVITIPFSSPITVTKSGDHVITGVPDNLYHAGLEYELSRHVPPSQASIRGGTPERAYHMFPHLTAMLIARFTRQPDMLRAHSTYHYAAITVLICLALYGIGCLLTSNRTGGYVCAFLPFLFAIVMPPMMQHSLGYFYFTALPHASSSLFPTLWSAPQMFSGLAVMYGVLLGVAAALRMPEGGRSSYVLPILCGLMVAALLRFRVHCWLVALPVFLVFAAILWYRSRRVAWLVSVAVTLLVSGLLYAEMSLPIYMRGTAEFHFALNHLSTIAFVREWPFSTLLLDTLQKVLSGTAFNWTWQILCLVGFATWDIIGIPLFLAVVLVPVIMKRTQALLYYWFTLGIIVLSIAFATCLTMGYDGYSVPGQLLYHLGWYALPLGGVAITTLICYLQRRMKYAWIVLLIAGLSSGTLSAITQHESLPDTPAGAVISPGAWDAFHYLSRLVPEDAVVLSTEPFDRKWFVVSGLGARSGYLEGAPNPVDSQAVKLNPQDNRTDVLNKLALAPDPASFCSILTATPVTHILERASARLMPNLPCLRHLATSRDHITTVWQVIRR